MIDKELLFQEQLREQRNIKLQLLPFVLQIECGKVHELGKKVNLLYKYISSPELDKPLTCTTEEVYEKFDVDPSLNTEYDIGEMDTINEECDNVPAPILPKSQDIELDCKDIKFVKSDVTEEVKPWNTEEFKKEFADFSAIIMALATSGALKLHGNKFDEALKQWPLFKTFYDKIMKCVPEKEREEHYALLTKRIHQSAVDFKKDKTVLETWEPLKDIDRNANMNNNHTPVNQEIETYEKQAKRIINSNNNYSFGQDELLAICEEHYASITNPKSVTPVKKSYFEEWDKERTLRLSQAQEPKEEQLLLAL